MVGRSAGRPSVARHLETHSIHLFTMLMCVLANNSK